LRDLYLGANALIFTSKAEGFGLPPLEAAALGVPFIASDINAVRENFFGAVPLISATDVASFVAAYKKITDDPTYKNQILSEAKKHINGLTWKKTSEQTLAAYKRVFPLFKEKKT
jgi:glycosyltransferase involved in cell wall biosynthesis